MVVSLYSDTTRFNFSFKAQATAAPTNPRPPRPLRGPKVIPNP
jgi:hypothetical protein